MSAMYMYLLVVAVLIVENAAEHVAYSGNVSACEGGTAFFHINESESREAGQLKFARWTYNDFEIIGAKQMLPVHTFGSRITYNWPTDPGFTISEVKVTDSGTYKCIKSFHEGHDETYLWTLEVLDTTHEEYNVTILSKTDNCLTLECGSAVSAGSTYTWTITREGVAEQNTTLSNKFTTCDLPEGCSVQCRREEDCTETTCFRYGPAEGDDSKKRAKRDLGGTDESSSVCRQLEDSKRESRSVSVIPAASAGTIYAVVVSVVVVSVVVVSVVVVSVVAFTIQRSRRRRRPDVEQSNNDTGQNEPLHKDNVSCTNAYPKTELGYDVATL